jgi:hypothetical protein
VVRRAPLYPEVMALPWKELHSAGGDCAVGGGIAS